MESGLIKPHLYSEKMIHVNLIASHKRKDGLVPWSASAAPGVALPNGPDQEQPPSPLGPGASVLQVRDLQPHLRARAVKINPDPAGAKN